MCHLVLMLPVIGLVVFWVMPLSAALPVYLLILLISGLFYYTVMKSMRRPVVTGKEGLVGQPVEIIDMTGHDGHVRVHGEIWRAHSDETLQKGEDAWIVDVKNLTLTIASRSRGWGHMRQGGHCLK